MEIGKAGPRSLSGMGAAFLKRRLQVRILPGALMGEREKTTYKQCKLVRPSTGQFEVAWIPNEFAKKGRWLKIKQADGSWVNGWQVEEAFGGTTLSAEEFEKKRDDLRRFKWVLGE